MDWQNLLLQARLRANRMRFRPRRGARTVTMGGCWGHHVSPYPHDQNVWSFPYEVYGHLPERPQAGDLVSQGMESGRTLIGTLQSVRLCRDPRDMFFGEVQWHTVRAGPAP